MPLPQNDGTDLGLLQSSAVVDDDRARANSNYCAYHEGVLFRLLESSEPSAFTRVAHAAFRSLILDNRYPCLGARAAINRGTYRIGAYERLDDESVSRGLLRDIHAFVTERRGISKAFTTFVAIFRDDVAGDEVGFERALWSQLERLHRIDRDFHTWDPKVSANPDNPAFSFSLGGEAFFVIGLHPEAHREARRFTWPALVFNAHEQFEDLKESGQFAPLQARIRERDTDLQGSLNPNLADFGHQSEARQYAGREVEADWKCPFRPN